jgi:hypothetical protein
VQGRNGASVDLEKQSGLGLNPKDCPARALFDVISKFHFGNREVDYSCF